MKTWRLVAGILSIVFFVVVMFQSCAAGIVNSMEDSGGVSGSVGILVGILLLTGGIVSIAVRRNEGNGGSIALIIIFGLAALFGLLAHGNYTDLIIWGTWSGVNAILALVSIIRGKARG